MKRLFHSIEDMLAATALAEMGLTEAARNMAQETTTRDDPGSVGDILSAAAFAESGEFGTADQIVSRWRKTREIEVVHPDDCQYGDNDLCFVQS